MIRTRSRLLFPLLATVALVAFGCSDDDPTSPGGFPAASTFPHDVATTWFDFILKLDKETPGHTPPVTSRSLGYAGVTLYEAVVGGMPDYQSLAGQLNGLGALPAAEHGSEYHWPTVANRALSHFVDLLFPTASAENKALRATIESDFAADFAAAVDEDVFLRSKARGEVIADAIYIWSLSDAGHEGYLRNFPVDYVPPVGPSFWVPTARLSGAPPLEHPLQPYWGQCRPFVLTPGSPNDDCHPGFPPEFSTTEGSAFYAEAVEVFEAVNTLTAEERAIALFWADDPGLTATPPGHSISILGQVLRDEDSDLARAAEAYAKVGMAVADAFIACWDLKYEVNLLRPITYIRAHIPGGGSWMTIVDTPPFPEYTSGHSIQSGAAFGVMTDLFGENHAFEDRTHFERLGVTRSYGSFSEAAEEAAISRLYGGIHFRAAIAKGIVQGRCIADKISGLDFRRPS